MVGLGPTRVRVLVLVVRVWVLLIRFRRLGLCGS
jgi:hypothetical protein